MNTTTTADPLNDKIDKLTAARVNAVLNEALLPLLALPSMKDLGSTIHEFRTRLTRILTPGVREKVVAEMLHALEPSLSPIEQGLKDGTLEEIVLFHHAPPVGRTYYESPIAWINPSPHDRRDPVAEDNLWDSVPPPSKPVRTLRFVVEGKEVGVFDLGATPMTFTGDVDESARSFVDNVLEMMGDASTRSKDEAYALLRRIARKGEFMDREGLRITVADWLARRHLSALKPLDTSDPVG